MAPEDSRAHTRALVMSCKEKHQVRSHLQGYRANAVDTTKSKLLFVYSGGIKLHDGHCELSIYGEALYQHLVVHPRRDNSKLAKLGIMPPFMAFEVHWPWYNKFRENMARTGTDCYTATVREAEQLHREYSAENRLSSGFFIPLVDLDPHRFHEMDSALYSNTLFS